MKARSGETVSSSTSAVICATRSPEARPAWQTVQVAFGPSPVSSTPEGSAAASSAWAAETWQEAQPMTALIAAGRFTTPASLPSAPRKSRKPGSEWQAAQFSGTAPSAFQCVNDGEW
jgi:hypothetical protein